MKALKNPIRSESEPVMSLSHISNLGRLWSTTNDLVSKPKKKSVKFSSAVHLVLIPTREEYCSAGLGSLMWWIDQDYSFFKQAAISELRNLMILDSRIDSKLAQIILYQPVSEFHNQIKLKLKDLSNHSALRSLFVSDVCPVNPDSPSNFIDEPSNNEFGIGLVKIDSNDDSAVSEVSVSLSSASSIPPISLTHVLSQVDLKHLQSEHKTDNKNSALNKKIYLENPVDALSPKSITSVHHPFSPVFSHQRNQQLHPLALICTQ